MKKRSKLVVLCVGAAAVFLLVLAVAWALRGDFTLKLELADRLGREGEREERVALREEALASRYEADRRPDLAAQSHAEAAGRRGTARRLFEDATEALKEAAALAGPERPEVVLAEGRLLVRRAVLSGAREAFKRAFDLLGEERGKLAAEALCGLGLTAEKAGNLGEALRYCDRAVKAAPGDPEARFGLGRVLVLLDEPEAALEHLDRACGSGSAEALWHDFRGRALERLFRLDEAVRAFERAVESVPEYGPKKERFIGNLESARNAARLAAEPGTDLERAAEAFSQGRAFERSGRLLEAAEAYRDAIAGFPAFAGAHYRRGLCLAAYGAGLGKLSEGRDYLSQAVNHFMAALVHWQGYGPYLSALAHALRDLGKAGEAESTLKEVIDLDPLSGRTWYELARLYGYAFEDAEAARRALEAASRLGVRAPPEFEAVLAEIGERASAGAGRTPEETEAERASSEAEVLLEGGEFAAAAATYARASEVLAGVERPGASRRRAEMAWRAAQAWEKAGKLRRALPWCRKAAELDPVSGRYARDLARMEALLSKRRNGGDEE